MENLGEVDTVDGLLTIFWSQQRELENMPLWFSNYFLILDEVISDLHFVIESMYLKFRGGLPV